MKIVSFKLISSAEDKSSLILSLNRVSTVQRTSAKLQFQNLFGVILEVIVSRPIVQCERCSRTRRPTLFVFRLQHDPQNPAPLIRTPAQQRGQRRTETRQPSRRCRGPSRERGNHVPVLRQNCPHFVHQTSSRGLGWRDCCRSSVNISVFSHQTWKGNELHDLQSKFHSLKNNTSRVEVEKYCFWNVYSL